MGGAPNPHLGEEGQGEAGGKGKAKDHPDCPSSLLLMTTGGGRELAGNRAFPQALPVHFNPSLPQCTRQPQSVPHPPPFSPPISPKLSEPRSKHAFFFDGTQEKDVDVLPK